MKVSLVMIVRNEGRVIERCLQSIKPFINHWTICDTGSTDDTVDRIDRLLKDTPGTLYCDQWSNFGENRTLAMQRARGTAAMHLLIDADMSLHVDDELRQRWHSLNLTGDGYLVPFRGPIDYSVLRLVSDRHEWRYVGSTHEYACSETAAQPERLAGLSIEHHEDGGSRREKYERDIKLLLEDQRKNPREPRTMFYLAQSYRDCGRLSEALDCYTKRALMGGWEEEMWAALYQIGCIQQTITPDWRVALNSYLQAYNFRPTRLEPIYRIAKFYREHQQWSLGLHFARLIFETPYPDDILFIERDVYEYSLLFEYAVCAHRCGFSQGAKLARETLISNKKTPTAVIQTVDNLFVA